MSAEVTNLIFLMVGAALALGLSFVQRIWANSDAVESEQRLSSRKLDEERRDWIRRAREKRTQPVADFLDLAKEALAEYFVDNVFSGADWDDVAARTQEKFPTLDAARVREVVDESVDELKREGRRYDELEFCRCAMRALGTASSSEMRRQVLTVLTAVLNLGESTESQAISTAIREAEETLETYVVEV